MLAHYTRCIDSKNWAALSEVFADDIKERLGLDGLSGEALMAGGERIIAELCDGWETGPGAGKSLEKLRQGSKVCRDAFAAAARAPNDLIVRSHLSRHMTADGTWFDFKRIVAEVPAMREAGVIEFAAGITGRLDGAFNSMVAIERFIGELAEFAAKA